MVFVKFIKGKNGKKNGPYYYMSVRDSSGRVRTVYLGKRPNGKGSVKEILVNALKTKMNL